MPKYTWLLMVVGDNGRYEKTLELPFVPQIGMTIFRGGAQLMWSGVSSDCYHQSPPITAFGWNIDEEQFEVEILMNREVKFDSAFWDRFVPL
jgi:hypothetical protein